MDRKKIIYIGILLIVTVLVSVTYFSYAFFMHRDEQHGKLNIVAGNLSYRIDSVELSNNTITLPANSIKVIEITLTSLNDIDSKYELYYEADDIVEIGYSTTKDLPIGTISKNGTKTIEVIVVNNNTTATTVTFGVQGGFISNNLLLATGTSISNTEVAVCANQVGRVWDFDYNGTNGTDGSVQTFNVPCSGNYKLETWGAQGGNNNLHGSNWIGGYGGYAVGNTNLKKEEILFMAIGGRGTAINGTSLPIYKIGGYNGGGGARKIGLSRSPATGGGATHIATVNGLLKDLSAYKGTIINNLYYQSEKILIVSGGGGGATDEDNKADTLGNGGSGGGYIGVNGNNPNPNTSVNTQLRYGSGGTQIAGGVDKTTHPGYSAERSFISNSSGFGLGAVYPEYDQIHYSGGGGGFFGGGSQAFAGPSGGGSGYIGSINLTDKHMCCFNCATSNDVNTKTISNTCHSTTATADCAKEGNGYARITYLGD